MGRKTRAGPNLHLHAKRPSGDRSKEKRRGPMRTKGCRRGGGGVTRNRGKRAFVSASDRKKIGGWMVVETGRAAVMKHLNQWKKKTTVQGGSGLK